MSAPRLGGIKARGVERETFNGRGEGIGAGIQCGVIIANCACDGCCGANGVAGSCSEAEDNGFI